jgi:hypothetical protein
MPHRIRPTSKSATMPLVDLTGIPGWAVSFELDRWAWKAYPLEVFFALGNGVALVA